MLGLLRDRKDLGIHSEMVPDSVVELIKAGVITGDRKTVHPHKVIAGFVLGSKMLFDFIDNNPIFEFPRTAYCNDPFLIAQNDRMVAINSAIEVDLTGQVCSDSMGFAPYSGIGGQVDFLRGAARAKGGLPIITLPSTAKDGGVSRIVPTLQPGAGVVTSRGDVHYVITEHGVAYLHGKTIRQRAEALIAIAEREVPGGAGGLRAQEQAAVGEPVGGCGLSAWGIGRGTARLGMFHAGGRRDQSCRRSWIVPG